MEHGALSGGSPLSESDTGPGMNRGRVANHHVSRPRGVACDAPLERVSREPDGHTRNDPSGDVWGDEHPVGPHEGA